MNGVRVRYMNEVMGYEVSVPYTTNIGRRSVVQLTAAPEGLNLSLTGTLNDDGIVALEQAIALGKIIRNRGLEL